MNRLLISCLTFILYLQADAQNNSTYSFALKAYPQYLFINGFRLDVEKSILNKFAVYVGPQIYSGLINSNGTRNKKLPDPVQSDDPLRSKDEINGYGFNSGCKFYFNALEIKEEPGERVQYFVGADVSYLKMDLKFSDYDYYPFYSNGLLYYSYDIAEKKETIKQQGLNFFFGVQKTHKRLTLEVVAGLGYRNADVPAGLKKFRNYALHPWDYGYSSVTPYGLISFGYYLF